MRIETDEDHLLLLNPPEGPLSDFVLAATQAIMSGQFRLAASRHHHYCRRRLASPDRNSTPRSWSPKK